jgi:hypothetical protein
MQQTALGRPTPPVSGPTFMDMWPRWPYPWAVGSKNVQQTEFIRGLELMQSAFRMYDCGAEKRVVGYWNILFHDLS